MLDGLVWGAALGAASGAVLGDAIDGLGAGLGALIGAALYAPAEVITTIRRGPAEPKPLWYRILSSALLMAVFGWLLGWIYAEPLFIALVSGALLGALGLRPGKAALGLLVGGVAGVLFQALDGGVEPALVAATVALTYRVIAAIAYRGRDLVRVMAEEVPASELRYVVPFEARSRYVGGDYVEQLAKARGGTFRRNPPDVGILASLDSLEGPTFDPSRVHPLIREFYEHTSRFRLSIIPEWRRWMKPGYELFKLVVAEPLGQAAIPSNIEEAQRGMVSTIDTITLDGDDEIDIRGWIRTFADSGKPIYIGIYTSFRHHDRGYVSVGFPIPERQLHRHPPAPQRGRTGLPPDLAHRPRVPRPLPELGRQRAGRADRLKAALFPGADLRLCRRRRAEDRPQLLPRRSALPDSPLRHRAPRRSAGMRPKAKLVLSAPAPEAPRFIVQSGTAALGTSTAQPPQGAGSRRPLR